jgi:hypothetical protein
MSSQEYLELKQELIDAQLKMLVHLDAHLKMMQNLQDQIRALNAKVKASQLRIEP